MQPKTKPPPPYQFQERAINEVDRKFREGAKSLVLVSPTGSGKTVMAAHAMQRPQYKNVRCISHRLSLNEQNRELLCPTYTPQALVNGLPSDFGTPDLVIWEECHHSEAPVFKTVRERFPKAKLLGLTATPQRADGQALELFEDMVVAAHYSELLLNRTIVPCEVRVPTEWREGYEPDLVKAYLRNKHEGARSLFFCKSIEQADDVASRLKHVLPYHCGMSRKHNREALSAFRAGQVEALTTVDALGEGIDVPEADMLVLGRMCHAVSTYLQYCGRVLRAARGKRMALIIDCVGASQRHGSPTEDRNYSITGTGIQRRGGHQSWEYDRDPGERQVFQPYDAKFKVLYGWQHPTQDDKRRQLGWLRQIAARQGYTEEVAEMCFRSLFGDEPPKSGKARVA